MCRLGRRHLKETLTLWERYGYEPDQPGEVVVSSPQEIKGRWEDKKREVTDPKGNSITTDAMVMVPLDLKTDSLLFRGTQEEFENDVTTLSLSQGGQLLLSQGNPLLVTTPWNDTTIEQRDDLYQVVHKDDVPNLRNQNVVREVGVIRFRRDLPRVI